MSSSYKEDLHVNSNRSFGDNRPLNLHRLQKYCNTLSKFLSFLHPTSLITINLTQDPQPSKAKVIIGIETKSNKKQNNANTDRIY